MDEYEVEVFGELEFPPGRIEEWRKLTVDGRLFRDWPEAFEWRAVTDDELVGVGTWLDDCARYEPDRGRLFLRLERAGDRISLRGTLDQSDYEAHKRELATIVRLAGLAGARGQLIFASQQEERFALGYRIDVRDGTSSMRKLSEAEIRTRSGR
jgi:hypothetical protein